MGFKDESGGGWEAMIELQVQFWVPGNAPATEAWALLLGGTSSRLDQKSTLWS
jgi:hypothetical protein